MDIEAIVQKYGTGLAGFSAEELLRAAQSVPVMGEPVAWACPYHAGEVTVNGAPCMLVSANCVNSFGKERGFPLHYVATSITQATALLGRHGV